MNGHARAALHGEWRMTFAIALIVAVSLLLVMAIDVAGVGIRPVELAVRIGHVILAVLVGVWLWARRHRQTHALCLAALLLLFVPLFPSMWLSEQTVAATGRAGQPWEPFFGHKVTAVGLAILGPGPVWFTPAIHVGLFVHAAALWSYLDLGAPAATVPTQEPWLSLAYLVISSVVYWVGVHHRNAVMRTRTEAATYEATTNAFIAAHDLANTPLQNLELALGLIERRHPDEEQVTARARRALARLKALLELFPVERVRSASVDPDALVRQRRR